MPALSGSPNHRIPWLSFRKRAAKIGQEDQSLRPNAMPIQPIKARAEVCPSAANRIEMNGLSGLIGFHFVYLSVTTPTEVLGLR